MKKLLVSALVLPLAFLAFQFPANASSSKTFFDGKTKQGLENFFIVEKIGGIPNFEPFFTNFTVTCNGNSFNYEWLFFGFQIPLGTDGSFDINLPSDSTPFDWHGRVTGTTAKGVQTQGYAAYGPTGGVIDCATGPVKWKATGVSSKAAAKVNSTWIVSVTKDKHGHISESYRQG